MSVSGRAGSAPTPLILVGAGGLARETVQAVRAINRHQNTWSIRGFLDDNQELHGQQLAGHPVLGPLDRIGDHPDVHVVVCVASPRRNLARKKVIDRLCLPADRYATIIHPAAILSDAVVIGRGSIVLASSVVTAEAVIGDHVIVMPACVFTHDDHIESYATFGAGVRLSGGVRVGEGAYIGTGALVREERTIGAGSLVGMGAIVTRDVPANETWAGVPARPIGRSASS